MDLKLKRLNEVLSKSVNLLGDAISQIKELNLEEKDEATRNIVSAIGSIFYARTFIPDPDAEEEQPVPDLPITPDEQARVARLNDEQIDAIDKLLLAHADVRWRKVARVVGSAMTQNHDNLKGIPNAFYSLRIRHLVEHGHLESEGNLDYMRYSEVRLPSNERNYE